MSVAVLHGRPSQSHERGHEHNHGHSHEHDEPGTVVLLSPHDVPDGAEVLGVLVRLPRAAGSRVGYGQGPAVHQLGRLLPGRAADAGTAGHAGAGHDASTVRPEDAGRRVRHGLVLDERARMVHSHGEPLELTRLEFDLLQYFTRHPGRVLTRDNLLHGVWDRDPAWASARTVDVHVLRLRRALGAQHSVSLQTVRGVGYRWVP